MRDDPVAGPPPQAVHVFRDARGALTLTELPLLPFVCRRVYALHDLPAGTHRGGHAARSQHRYLVFAGGRAEITLDDGRAVRRVEPAPGTAIHVPPGMWIELETLDDEVMVIVFASGDYDPSDTIRDRSALPITASHTAST